MKETKRNLQCGKIAGCNQDQKSKLEISWYVALNKLHGTRTNSHLWCVLS